MASLLYFPYSHICLVGILLDAHSHSHSRTTTTTTTTKTTDRGMENAPPRLRLRGAALVFLKAASPSPARPVLGRLSDRLSQDETGQPPQEEVQCQCQCQCHSCTGPSDVCQSQEGRQVNVGVPTNDEAASSRRLAHSSERLFLELEVATGE